MRKQKIFDHEVIAAEVSGAFIGERSAKRGLPTMIQRTLLVILMVLCPLDLALAGDWPQWRGPDRTDVSKETGLLTSWPPGGPKLLWTFRDAGAGHSCMAVVGDRLYSMGADDTKEYVYAIDLKTQKKLWSVEAGARFKSGWGDGPCSTPTVDGNFLYALGRYGNLVCVETVSGKMVWSRELNDGRWHGHGYTESPLVDGDRVVVTPGSKEGMIAAFDKKTGTPKWRCTTFSDVCYSSMIAIESSGVRQYVQSTFSHVVSVRASDGELLWEFARGNGINGDVATPTYHGNCVYVSSANGGNLLLKLIREGGQFKIEQIYADKDMQNDYCGAVLLGDYLYGYFGKGGYFIKGGWTCHDFKTGKTVWKKDPGMGPGSVTFADGNLYGYHEKKGDVLLLKATSEGYQQQGKFRIPEQSKLRRKNKDARIYTHPVVANGKLYLRDQDLIFCYDVRKPQ